MTSLQDRITRFNADEGALIADYYDGVGTSHFFQTFMERLAGVMQLRSGSLGISNLTSREIKGGWPWNIEPLYLAIYVAGDLASKDRLLQHVMQSPPGSFYGIEADLPNAEEYQQSSEVYETWATPQGIRDVAMALLWHEEDWVGFVVLHRTQEQGPFLEQEFALLNRLLPHMQRGLELHHRLVDGSDHQQSIGRWLEMLRPPALLYDEKFELTHINSAAHGFLEQQSGVRVNDGRLDFDDPALNSQVGFQVMAAIKLALGQYELEPEMVKIDGAGDSAGDSPYTLVFLPLKDNGNKMVTTASALVLIYDERIVPKVALTPLQDLFQLTAAELRVCEALANGFSLLQIAEREGKSKETLRTQLRRIFSKLRVNNQTELVVTLMTHPAVLLPS